MNTSTTETGDALQAGDGKRARYRWPGHLPATRARLIAILERVVQGQSECTLAERVLVAACEFWSLAMAGELHLQTDLRAMGKLRFAAMVYDAIGAEEVASALRTAHVEMSCVPAGAQRRQRMQVLEENLQRHAPAVDALLAKYAERLDGKRVGSAERHSLSA
jgi:hypothetical protein